jgi:hypothetical protein
MRRLVTGLLVCLMVGACLGPRTDGPLQPTGQVGVGLPLQDTGTWGMPLGQVAAPYELQRIELVEVSGFDVIAIKACEGSPWVGDSYLNCAPNGGPWPPAGVVMREVNGARVGTRPEEGAGILIGVKLASGASSGRISGVRIFYVYRGVEYLVVEPWVLEMPPS